MNRSVRLVLYGLLTWAVPFVVSFGFYDSEGQLTASYGLFKSTMVAVSALTGCFALYKYLSNVTAGFSRQGWICGITWLAINFLLDMAVLIPMSGMSMVDYTMNITPGYLVIPAMCVTGGILVDRVLQKKLTP